MVQAASHEKLGIIPFQVKGCSSHEAALLFNKYGIMMRSGFHCAQPLHEVFKLESTARASFYIYNTKEEIDRFIEVLKEFDQTLMSTVADYVARIEGTCGAESDVIVIFKYEKKDEAIANILKKTRRKNTIAGIIFEITYQEISFRLYTSGKAIFRGVKSKT